MEKLIEKIIWQSRLMIFLAVVSGIISALILVLMGTYDVFIVVKESFHLIGDEDFYKEFHRDAITHIIGAIDSFLIATVLLIFGIGLYELFINKIDLAEQETKSSKILVIHNLDQLKEKIAKVILMVLIVTFFKYAVNFKYVEILDLLYLSIGIFLIALSIYFTHKK
ncbi:MAG: YqhA family protein [Nitrospinae bacterium]|nr:YqhA family protein [Nitrospinota bacterium]